MIFAYISFSIKELLFPSKSFNLSIKTKISILQLIRRKNYIANNFIDAAHFTYFIVSLTSIFPKKSNSHFRFLVVRMKKNIDKVFL